ncbi:hypothetical protein N9937_00865 [bacterium]|nr:hypothetical protein [bacterium]
MKQSDLKEVNFLSKVLSDCRAAREDIPTVLDYHLENGGGYGFKGFNYGYSSYIHVHSDGSGAEVEMSGCYIGVQLAEAADQLLLEQIDKATARLKDLGVEIDVEEDDQ